MRQGVWENHGVVLLAGSEREGTEDAAAAASALPAGASFLEVLKHILIKAQTDGLLRIVDGRST